MQCNANFAIIGLKSHESRGTMTIIYLTPLSTCIYQADSCKAIGIDSHECNVSTYLKVPRAVAVVVEVVVVVEVDILAVIFISSDQEG